MEKAIEIIKKYESLHDGDLTQIGLQPKLCPAGVWTVGYGRAIIDPATGKQLKGAENKKRAYELYPALTIEQAIEYLNEDYAARELQVKDLLKTFAEAWEVGAMVSLAYNIGMGNFRQSSVLRFFNGGNKQAAADSFKLWIKTDGKVMAGLQLRRLSEIILFQKNELKFFERSAIKIHYK